MWCIVCVWFCRLFLLNLLTCASTRFLLIEMETIPKNLENKTRATLAFFSTGVCIVRVIDSF